MPDLPHEFEAKYYFVDPHRVRSVLERVGATLIQPEMLYRRAVFEPGEGGSMHGDYARVRDEGSRVTMSVKRHAKEGEGMAENGELCLTIDSFETGRRLLAAMGMHEKAYQETKRETWGFEGVEICIDTWPGLDPYVEIEAPSEVEVLSVAKLLGLDDLRSTPSGVDVLYSEIYGVSGEVVNRQTPLITFDHPPVWTTRRS